jgi:hypothetical protein
MVSSSSSTLLCKKILTFCFCSQLQQAQRYAKLLAPSKKVSYQTTIVDLFLPMSQVGNSKWIPTCHPSKNPSVSERHAKAGAKAMDKVWFEKRHRCCTRPGGLASFRDHPDEFLRNTFFSVVFCVGVPLPLGWRFVTKLMLADLDSSVFGKTRTIRKISKSRTHCFKPDCLKRSKSSCILPGSSLL